jgi:hypothetical protein
LANLTWRDLYAHRSSWHVQRDTLYVRVFTGLVGWDLILFAGPDGYHGTGRYLTDAIVAGAAPLIVRVSATRRTCVAPAGGYSGTKPHGFIRAHSSNS